MTDDEILLIKSKDRAAVERWVREWETPIFRIAYRILGSHADAEEARQNTFLNALNNTNRWPPAARHDAWLRRCAINAAITIGRKKTRSHAHQLHADVESDSAFEPHDLVDLRDAMAQLDAETRALLSLRFDEGLTIRQIGEVMETAHTTIQSRIDRAISALQARLCTGENHV